MEIEQLIHRDRVVPVEYGGKRVDQVAASLFDEFSRMMLSQWITLGDLTVDGHRVKPKTRLLGGERLVLDAVIKPIEDWATPQSVEFEVVFEDDSLLVINKPAGLVVHPGAGNPDQTLVNGLLAYRAELGVLPRAGIIHRLDKDTSGLLLIAATPATQQTLIRDLAARTVERRYLAITEGRLVAGRNIEAPIGRDPRNRTRQKVRKDGRAALTRIRVLERFERHSLIEAQLETGRTHQIRVHLADIGHPLVGDRRYGARGKVPSGATAELVTLLHQFPRQALHAYKLGITHPVSGEEMHFEAPLPEDIDGLLAALRIENARKAGDGT